MNTAANPDWADATQALERDGFVVVPGALSPSETADVRRRLFTAVERSEQDGVPTRGYAFDPDEHNVRVFQLFNLDDIFVDLIQRPLALSFVEHLLGDQFLVSNFSANITEPGNAPMQLHADQGYVLPPWPARPLACNVAWLLDDLTLENGATRYVPKSHLLGHGPDPDRHYESASIEAPAGSILVMDGRLWHQTGINRTRDEKRAVLFGYYVLRWLRPQINWNAALWPETLARLPEDFLHLLGVYTGNVEFQIPHGKKSALSHPAALAVDDGSFVLGQSEE